MKLKLGFGEVSISNENQVFMSHKTLKSFDLLIFFDSRGLTIKDNLYQNTYLYNLLKNIENQNLSYIAVSRPKNLTTFVTLYNYLKLNESFKFKTLITNLGFVDCTPKKEKNINDLLLQLSQFIKLENEVLDLEEYDLANGETEVLQSINYSLLFKEELASYFNSRFQKMYYMNTPILSKETKIERRRPLSFWKQLHVTNSLVNELIRFDMNKSKLIDISELSYTYDGVHYTSEGHSKIYKKILEGINI